MSETKKEKNFLFLDEYDDVLDIINEFPEDMKQGCLKFLSHEPDKGSNFVFMLPDRGFGVIIKLVKEGDDGLVFLGADDGRTIVEKLEEVRDNAPLSERHKVDSIVNQVRYSIALINQELINLKAAKMNEVSPEKDNSAQSNDTA